MGGEDGGQRSVEHAQSAERTTPSCDATQIPREPRDRSMTSLHQKLSENNLMGVSPINEDASFWLIISKPSPTKRKDTQGSSELETKRRIYKDACFLSI